MTVVSFDEIHEGREGGDSSEHRRRAKREIRRFRAITNSAYDATAIVLGSGPLLGAPHPTYAGMYCRDRKAVNERFSKLVWIVTCTYSNDYDGLSDNPLNDVAKTTRSTDTRTEMAEYDKDGYAILNSAGDFYVDNPKVERTDWVIKVKKNLDGVPTWIDSYRDAINSDGFWLDGLPIYVRQAKIKGISIGEWEQRNDIWFRPVEINIGIRTRTWVCYVKDHGLYEKIDGWPHMRIHDKDGQYVTKPVALDGTGLRLGSIDEPPAPNEIVWNAHYVYPELPFSLLPLW